MTSISNEARIVDIQSQHYVQVNEELRVPRVPKKNIFVISGDPRKPNLILPGGQWDQDDFETMDKFKSTLKSLEDFYEFSWLNNHEALLEELVAKNSSIDMVLQLCDDGWMNHPRMEMHVAAYLETLGIPFTGSGSKCLAISYDKVAFISHLYSKQC